MKRIDGILTKLKNPNTPRGVVMRCSRTLQRFW